MKKTIHFENCSAPLCLQADDLTDDSFWYPDAEEICGAQIEGGVPNWIKTQRKIVKVTKGFDVGGFTLGMLKRDCVICKGIKGIDVDRDDIEAQIKRWFAKHKTKRIKTEIEKQVFMNRMKVIRLRDK